MLVTNATDSENKPPPQLAETLSWLANLRDDVREHLLRTEPLLLLRSDAASSTDEFKAILVKEILKLFIEEKVLDDRDLQSYYSRLKHPNIAAQLRPFIVDREQGWLVRRVATDIAQECEVRDLQEDLVQLVLDEDDYIYTRINAGYAVWRVANKETRAKLKEMALHGSPTDIDQELRGVALLSTWNDVITADELFNSIVHPPQGFYGSYSSFLSRFVGLIGVNELPRAIQWVREKFSEMSSDFSLKRVMSEIMATAENNLDRQEILDEFAQTVAALLRNYSFKEILDPRTRTESENREFFSDEEKRRNVLRAIARYTDGDEKDTNAIGHSNALRPRIEDLPWLLEELERAEADNEQWLFARLVGAFYAIYSFEPRAIFAHVRETRPDAFGLLYAANARNATVRKFFAPIFDQIRIDSDLATQLKEAHEAAVKYQKELAEMSQPAPLIEPPPNVRVDDRLTKIENGELVFFWGLSQELTLEPDSQFYGQWTDCDITDYPGWKVADSVKRTRIVEVAKKYVMEGEPENEEWVGTKSYQNVALAGYHALFLLLKTAPEFVRLLPAKVWKKWAPIITLFPYYGEHENEKELHQFLAYSAYVHAPDDVLNSIARQIALENNDSNVYFPISNKFEKCWDDRFRSNLRKTITEGNLNAGLQRRILGELMEHGDVLAQEIAELPFRSLLAGNAVSGEELESVAIALSQHAVQARWSELFWKAIQTDTTIGRRLVEIVHHYASPAANLSEKHTADFYVWLEQQYPHGEDEPMTRGMMAGVNVRQEIGKWRDSFLSNLKNRGTAESVNELERIASQFPELVWLKHLILEAKTITRRNTWEPLTPQGLFEIIGETETKATEVSATTTLNDGQIDRLTFIGKAVSDTRHLSALLKRFRDRPNDFVFFTGAGLSMPLFPSWAQALETLMNLRSQGRDDGARQADLVRMFQEEQFLEVADICAKDLGEIEYRSFIGQTFDKEFEVGEIPSAYAKLLELAPRTILTTNYDRVPEVGGAGLYRTFSNQESAAATIEVQERNPLIFKVHGSVTSPDSIIFTSTEYQNTYLDGAFSGLIQAVVRLNI